MPVYPNHTNKAENNLTSPIPNMGFLKIKFPIKVMDESSENTKRDPIRFSNRWYKDDWNPILSLTKNELIIRPVNQNGNKILLGMIRKSISINAIQIKKHININEYIM